MNRVQEDEVILQNSHQFWGMHPERPQHKVGAPSWQDRLLGPGDVCWGMSGR